jgi:uncharacterized spore protein YtfJ
MDEDLNKVILESIPSQQRAMKLLSRLFKVTQPGAVFSEPVVSGDYTVITAAEVTAATGFGYGGGGGYSPEGTAAGQETARSSGGMGQGGGGGGTALARPVAAIIIGPDGVRVEPIVDATKIALAFFTTIGAFILTLRKMRQFRQTGKLD